MTRMLRFGVVLFFLLLLAVTSAGGQEPNLPAEATQDQSPQILEPASILQDPVPIVLEKHGSFAYGGGLLYWEADCAYEVDPRPVHIRRMPETGGATQTLYEVASPTVEQCASVSQYNVADDDGFFYANIAEDRLDARLSHDPTVVVPLITDLGTAQPVYHVSRLPHLRIINL